MIDYLINVGCNGPSQFMIQRPKQRTDPGDPHGLQSDLDSDRTGLSTPSDRPPKSESTWACFSGLVLVSMY